jgi:hypothetical protein
VSGTHVLNPHLLQSCAAAAQLLLLRPHIASSSTVTGIPWPQVADARGHQETQQRVALL